MALKKVNIKNGNETSLENQLKKEIAELDCKTKELLEIRVAKTKQLLELEIRPFKIGDYALVKVPSGKSQKEKKCLLESGNYGILFARPVKENGELSGRHFSIIPVGEQKYSDFLKEVK